MPVRGSSGPAAASAARRLGTSSGCVSARHRRPITSSWRSPSAALKRRAGVLDQPVAVEHPHEVGGVVDERGDAGRLARLGLGLGDLRVGGDDRAVGQRRRARGDPDVAAVGVRDPELLVDAGVAALDARGGDLLGRKRAAAGRAQRARVARRADQHLGREADQPSHRLVGVEDDPVRVEDEDRVLERFRERQSGRARPSPAGAHPVPDAADGGDEIRRPRVVLQLAPQVGDVDVDQVVVAEPVLAPDALEQLGAAERDARLRGERVEQVELDPGELERADRRGSPRGRAGRS